jgi:16S rRNA (uracil1498-N3)-methyltransferase
MPRASSLLTSVYHSDGPPPMEYFYTPPDRITSDALVIEDEEFAHLTHVMRRSEGDHIRVVDGAGQAYEVRITSVSRKSAHCVITERLGRIHEPSRELTLAVALLKNGSNVDFLVEKCTELGVNEFVPLITERTIPRHDRRDRWQKLALSAMKQSGRCVLPRVRPMMQFSEYINRAPAETLRLIPHEKITEPSLQETLGQGTKSVEVCIGPEGGFTDGEILQAVSAGWNPVSLGQRRLRAETAAVAATALVLLQP